MKKICGVAMEFNLSFDIGFNQAKIYITMQLSYIHCFCTYCNRKVDIHNR